MSALVERLGAPLRAAARRLEEELADRGEDIVCAQAPRAGGLGYSLPRAEAGCRGAWWLLGQWLCAYALGAIGSDATLQDAEAWFYGDGAAADRRRLAPRGVTVPLQASPGEAWSLLPYLLDPAGQGTRRQVMGSDAHRADRDHRKKNGVYYTPADVAHFMAGAAMGPGARTVLDPACGTAVFLRASLMLNPDARVFGVDVDPLAIEMAAFVLLASTAQDGPTPWACWHQHRLGLAVADALSLRSDDGCDELTTRARQNDFETAKSALAGGIVGVRRSNRRCPLASSATCFPPAAIGCRCRTEQSAVRGTRAAAGLGELASQFASYSGAPPTSASNIFLPFVE